MSRGITSVMKDDYVEIEVCKRCFEMSAKIWRADCGVGCACEEISMSEISANDVRWFVLSPNIGCLISRQHNH
jgi:hypothetical protein